jgi:hypothetical protein
MKALLKRKPKAGLRFEIRNPNLGLRLFPRMIIRDEEEVMFFITSKADGSMPEQDNVCLWTNCKDLVNAFSGVFEDLWRNSTDIERKITEIETGKPTPETFVISDAEAVKKKYDEIVQSATEEIMILTSSKGLIGYWKNMPQLKNWTKKGIAVKIMAPIAKENVEAAEQLSKFCAIRHVPIHYWGTTIVDGKHLFQFKTPAPEKENQEAALYFKNAFYTNNLEYVEQTKTALTDIWRNAQAPSAATLESIIGPYGPPVVPLPMNDPLKKMNVTVIDFKPPGTITEKDVLNKIINAQKIQAKDPLKDLSRSYSSMALAVIHPPDYFNLPDMMIQAFHYDKQSSFGEEDALIIHLWLETPTGHAYVPVVWAGENPNAQDVMRAVLAGTPAGQNVQLFKKDEIQVRVHGNTLFAGWTMPIPLLPPKYTLPPACILIEGYGDVKTMGFTIVEPSGFKLEAEQNYFDAFVTFIHPASKYSGPGTDGAFARDIIVTNTPP